MSKPGFFGKAYVWVASVLGLPKLLIRIEPSIRLPLPPGLDDSSTEDYGSILHWDLRFRTDTSHGSFVLKANAKPVEGLGATHLEVIERVRAQVEGEARDEPWALPVHSDCGIFFVVYTMDGEFEIWRWSR